MRLAPIMLALPLITGGEHFVCDRGEPVELAGRDLYVTHCAECHGADARGGGPGAALLETAPADLTRLGERHGLPLPVERLADYVDGRTTGQPPAQGHALREMPRFGERFYEGLPPDADRESSKRLAIELILAYLETLQPPPGD